MAETHFDEWIAERYERLWPELFEPDAIDPVVEFLAGLAGTGRALEFAIGTGRIAIPLARRGLDVHGIELSPAMVGRLHGALTNPSQRSQPSGPRLGVTVGDFATTRIDGTFQLVYLLRNTITNLTTQDEQVAAFANAAAHLDPGGFFVIENYVPALQRLPPGETTYLFAATPTHVGFETYDVAAQIAVSHHYWQIDGELRAFSSPHRYVWPSELDLMARLGGLTLRERWADWDRTPFTSESRDHISVWQKVGLVP
jgi:SAM-dependent methyltransferase